MLKIFTALRRRFVWVWSRREIKLLKALLRASLEKGNVPAAMFALEVLSSRYCWHQSVEKLLFYRANRPNDYRHTISLFKAISIGSFFLRHHRAYARVNMGYLAVKSNDINLAKESQLMLLESAALLENDPKVLRCHLRNRENNLKLLVSTKTVLLHLSLMLKDSQSIAAIGLWAHNLLAVLDFDQVKADVALRMISNFSRCLALYAVIDAEAAVHDLHRLIVEAGRQRHHWSRASENHLEFVQNIVSDLCNEQVPKILTVESPSLHLKLSRFWLNFTPGSDFDW